MDPLPFSPFRVPDSIRVWVKTAILAAVLSGGGSPAARPAEAPGALREIVQGGDPAAVTRFIADAPADQRDRDAVAALVWSAYYGKLDLLKAMLRCGVPVTAADEHGTTALEAAVRGNQPAAVSILLSHGAGTGASAAAGLSAAALAAQPGRTASAARLSQGANAAAGQGTANPFAAAVQAENLGAIRTCLADPAFRVDGKAAQDGLLLAIRRNDAALAVALLDHGASANEPADPAGLTPLVAVAKSGHADLAHVLLDRGADPDRPLSSLRAQTPLMAAIAARAEPVALLLARHAVQTHHPLKTSLPLFLAIGSGLSALVEPLVAAGADVNAVNDDGATPLMWAVLRCQAAVDPLLARHPRLDLRDHAGRSVFDLPEGGWLAEKMRRAGAGQQVDAVLAAPRRSPAQLTDGLLAAVKQGDAAGAKALLDQGADPEACNRLKWPVSVLAASLGRTEILRLLYERDHSIAWQMAPGHWTPLLEAAGNGHLETVRFLLAHHAEPELVNDLGHSALDYAESRDYPEVAEVLREAASQRAASLNLPPSPRVVP